MKTPNIFFSSKAFATAALLAVSAMAFPMASKADERWDRDHGRPDWNWRHDWDRSHGHPIYYSRTRQINVSVQRALTVRGYYYGPADGDIGPGTRRAIMRFQAEHHMRPTGIIDGMLLRALHVD